MERQMDKRYRTIEILNFSPFNPANEKMFEDWLDKASETITTYRVCAPIFQEAWISVANSDISGIISRVRLTNNHEDLVDKVALQLFPFTYSFSHSPIIRKSWKNNLCESRDKTRSL